MSYKYVEDVTAADIAFQAEGPTLDKMFESAGLAVTNTMVKDLKAVKPKIKKTIKLSSDSIDRLLFDFLQEFVFWKDKSLLLFSKASVKIKEPVKKGNKFQLSAILAGEKLDMKKHAMIVDVKAVTWHQFRLEKKQNKWTCQVVLDV